jgi:hypothetical protein
MRLYKSALLVLGLMTAFSWHTNAQENIDDFLGESVEDANKLIGAYASPFMKSVSVGLNHGWYNTAKTHKIAGVDLTITVNALKIPDDQLLYDPSKLGLTQIELDPASPGYPTAPTMLGPDVTPTFRDKDNPSNYFDGPPGLDLEGNVPGGRMPVPMAHLGFGLPKGTDLKLRFTPSVNLGDENSFKLFGIGVMHDIKQWIPGIKLMPFDLSAFVAFTKLEATTQLDADNPQNADQKGVFTIKSTTIQGVISKKISVVTFYGGLGYNIAKSTLALKGSYDLNEDGDETDQFEKNPIDLSFAASGMSATAGIRLKLTVLTFHADYTLQKYNCLSVGFGIAVR